jgi:hypothetical protein
MDYDKMQQLFLICHNHREIISLGTIPYSAEGQITHHSADITTLWTAFSRFSYDHAKCGCIMMAETQFYELEWIGYKKKDNAYGIPYKGPENVFDL